MKNREDSFSNGLKQKTKKHKKSSLTCSYHILPPVAYFLLSKLLNISSINSVGSDYTRNQTSCSDDLAQVGDLMKGLCFY